MTETLHTGDNLEYMRTLPDASIDLIYSDILYGTGRNFGDYQDIKANRKDVEAFYIPRIKEMHRLLKKTGSIYLQMDTRINHWLRCILDDVFGYNNFLNEIVWCYSMPNNQNRKYKQQHDVILFYSKNNTHVFNLQYIPYKSGLHGTFNNFKYSKGATKQEIKNKEAQGKSIEDWWHDIYVLNSASKDRSYQTQKPIELMSRIIKASSNEGDVCADFFAGSGSFGVAAKKLNRNVILNDINPDAIKLCSKRLRYASDLFNCG